MKKASIYLSLMFLFLLGCTNNSTGKVTAYTTLDESLAREIFKSFTNETGITVDWIRLSTGECVARMEAEKGNPQASIWVGGVGLGHIEAKIKGLTKPYNSPAAKVPPQFRDTMYYWTGLYAAPLCFESNTVKLEQYGLKAPTSWKEISSPEFDDHVQMAHPASSGTSYNILTTIVQIFGEEKAFEYLSGLNSNITHYTRSGLAPGKNMSIGEVAVAIGYLHDGLKLKNDGYPVQITFPEEGTGYEIASVSLINNQSKREATTSKILYDWMFGKTATRIFSSNYVVTFIESPNTFEIPSIYNVKTVLQDDKWAVENKTRLIEKWNESIENNDK